MRNSPFKNVQVRNYWLVTSHHDFKCNYVLINCDKSAFSDFTICYYPWKFIKKSHGNNKLKTSGTAWNE